MEESLDNQANNKQSLIERIQPYQWKKGQSGNPTGRPKGKTMKEYAKELLACQTEDERQEFLHGLSKDIIWKMAEGNPETKTDVKINKDVTFTEEELAIAQQIIAKRLSDTITETSSGATIE